MIQCELKIERQKKKKKKKYPKIKGTQGKSRDTSMYNSLITLVAIFGFGNNILIKNSTAARFS